MCMKSLKIGFQRIWRTILISQNIWMDLHIKRTRKKWKDIGKIGEEGNLKEEILNQELKIGRTKFGQFFFQFQTFLDFWCNTFKYLCTKLNFCTFLALVCSIRLSQENFKSYHDLQSQILKLGKKSILILSAHMKKIWNLSLSNIFNT